METLQRQDNWDGEVVLTRGEYLALEDAYRRVGYILHYPRQRVSLRQPLKTFYG